MLLDNRLASQEVFCKELLEDNSEEVNVCLYDGVDGHATSSPTTKQPPGWLPFVYKRKEKEAKKAADLLLKTTKERFKPSNYTPKTPLDAYEATETSLFPAVVREMHPGMFISPNYDDALDFAIWRRTSNPRKVINAQSARGTRDRARELKIVDEVEKWGTIADNVTTEETAEARARLDAWLAESDTQPKRMNRGKEEELILLWLAWTIGTRRLGRDPKLVDFILDVVMIGGDVFVKSRKAARVRHKKMVDFHGVGGPWQPVDAGGFPEVK
jgi:hypothetical protein